MNRSFDDYIRLITQFYRHRPDFVATVGALVAPPIQAGETTAYLSEAFDLDTAIGVQLDIVGEWVGKDRFVPYPLESFYFSFDDAERGFDLAVWKGPYEADFGMYRLADEDYRRLLYAKIGLNYWDGTFESLEDTLLQYYADPALSPGALFFLDDRHDMSATFGVAGVHPPPLILAILAWPALAIDAGGIEVRTRVVSVNGMPLFGFDMSNTYVSGFNQGAWGMPPVDIMFGSGGEPPVPPDAEGGIMDWSDPDQSGLIAGVT